MVFSLWPGKERESSWFSHWEEGGAEIEHNPLAAAAAAAAVAQNSRKSRNPKPFQLCTTRTPAPPNVGLETETTNAVKIFYFKIDLAWVAMLGGRGGSRGVGVGGVWYWRGPVALSCHQSGS